MLDAGNYPLEQIYLHVGEDGKYSVTSKCLVKMNGDLEMIDIQLLSVAYTVEGTPEASLHNHEGKNGPNSSEG